MILIMQNRGANTVAPPARNGRGKKPAPARLNFTQEVAFGYPRDFLANQLVYLVISPRANGLSVGVNLNPALNCNLDCRYCEVDRAQPSPTAELDLDRMVIELRETLELARGGWLRQWPRYAKLPPELLQIRHVALSGDGEPTLSRQFVPAVRAVVQLRNREGFFKIVLPTNATALELPAAQAGLALLRPDDEVWAKLDGGTQGYLERVNGSTANLDKILGNILLVGRQRPVVIQSLFPELNGEEPPAREIEEYALRLKELKEAGATIPLVQIYSLTRPAARRECGHLSLKSLSQIAQTVRRVSGLKAEVF